MLFQHGEFFIATDRGFTEVVVDELPFRTWIQVLIQNIQSLFKRHLLHLLGQIGLWAVLRVLSDILVTENILDHDLASLVRVAQVDLDVDERAELFRLVSRALFAVLVPEVG